MFCQEAVEDDFLLFFEACDDGAVVIGEVSGVGSMAGGGDDGFVVVGRHDWEWDVCDGRASERAGVVACLL